MRDNSVSVIIPAFNEETNIKDAIKSVVSVTSEVCPDYEILVVNDGSSDGTYRIIKEIAKINERVIAINLPKHMGLGFAIRQGIKEATKEYITVFPGDNDMDPASLADLIKQKKEMELVFSYLGKSDTRKLLRRIASLTYVGIVSILFNLKVEYYNGPFICKTKLLKNLRLISRGFTIYAELKIRLIKKGHSYKEIPFVHVGRRHGSSKALTISSIINTLWSTFLIWRDIQK